jgi:hypothetical protein
VNQEGHEYQAWVKLNFKNTMNNGNYEMKQYHTNYGFDLEKTLGHYPIKELANPQYKESLDGFAAIGATCRKLRLSVRTVKRKSCSSPRISRLAP